jgi:hypothetical protein
MFIKNRRKSRVEKLKVGFKRSRDGSKQGRGENIIGETSDINGPELPNRFSDTMRFGNGRD